MKRSQVRNKIIQMLYRPNSKSRNPEKELKELDNDIEKAINTLFGSDKKAKESENTKEKEEA